MRKILVFGVVMFFLLVCSVSATVIGNWTFSGNALDSSPTGANGTVFGATLENDIFGNANSSYYFNKKGGQHINTSFSLLNRSAFTIISWVNRSDLDGTYTNNVVSQKNGADSDFIYFAVTGCAGVLFYITDGTNTCNVNTGCFGIGYKSWERIAGVWDGTNCTVYGNGVQLATAKEDANIDTISINGNTAIGRLGSDANVYWNGSIDNVLIFDTNLSSQQISDDYSAEVDDTIDLSATLPVNGSQFNVSLVSFNLTVNSSYVFNCSLYVNGSVNQTRTGFQNGTGVWVDFNVSFVTEGGYTYKVNCTNGGVGGSTQFNSEESDSLVFYVDVTNPAIVDNFVNDAVYFRDNITGEFNFSDNVMLYSFNITVDGVEIDSVTDLNVTFYSYNLSYSSASLVGGNHTLGVKLADGHTSNVLGGVYGFSNGLFNDYSRYGFWDGGYVVTESKAKSVFDVWESECLVDRCVQTFKPSSPSSSYVFVEESDMPIHIVRKDGFYKGGWLIMGNHWKDYVLKGEPQSTVSFKRLSPYVVEVTVSNVKNRPEFLEFESVGDLNVISKEYPFYVVNASVIYQAQIYEGSLVTHVLEINGSGVGDLNASANLVWNYSSRGEGTETLVTNDSLTFVQSFTAPTLGLSMVNWSWNFNFSLSNNFNVSGNHSYVSMNLTNCSSGNIVLNYTLFDEENKTIASFNESGSVIELDLDLSSYSDSGMSWNFNHTENDPELLVCLPDSFLNNSPFRIDATVKYSHNGHEIEYHHIDNFNLSNAVIPVYNNLYDLLTADSTSFLMYYQDENYLYIDGAIIDVLRYYPGEGRFLSVEHTRTDDDGQGLAHLVSEDVIYYFNVWIDGVLEFTSPEYLALCQATPCQINLRKTVDYNESVFTLDDLVYDISSNSEVVGSRVVVFDFSTSDGTSTGINLSVFDSLENESVGSDYLLASAGSVSVSIPLAYANDTYVAKVFRDGVLVGYKSYYLDVTPDDIFGQDGIFLTFIGFITLGLAGISSGIASIVLGVLGVVAMGTMMMVYTGNLWGIGSTVMWLVVAGGIIIWKITRRRIQ